MRERVQVVSGSDVYLGLDISKTSWHVTARSGGETLMSASFPPKREALKGLLERLEGCRIHSAYETGRLATDSTIGFAHVRWTRWWCRRRMCRERSATG